MTRRCRRWNGLKAGATPALTIEIDQYRAFCLFALGRTREAEAVAESVVRANPLVDLQAADTSPRIVALFTDLQKRLLPGLIRERYRTARASMDEGDTAATQAELVLVQRMLAKAKSVGAWDDALADINVLVDGFLELNRAAERRAAGDAPSADSRGVRTCGISGVDSARTRLTRRRPHPSSRLSRPPCRPRHLRAWRLPSRRLR